MRHNDASLKIMPFSTMLILRSFAIMFLLESRLNEVSITSAFFCKAAVIAAEDAKMFDAKID